MDKPELSKANKIVLGYFLKVTGKNITECAKPETVEDMLLLVQMTGHAEGYSEGLADADEHRAEDKPGYDKGYQEGYSDGWEYGLTG